MTLVFVEAKSPSRPLMVSSWCLVSSHLSQVSFVCSLSHSVWLIHVSHLPLTGMWLLHFWVKGTFNSSIKNDNLPHDKQEWQVHNVDMKIGMKYHEFYEVGIIELYFKVDKLKTLVWCLKKILTQLLVVLIIFCAMGFVFFIIL